MRYDEVNSYINESKFSLRLGAIYEINHKTKIFVGYAKYFTPPSNSSLSSSLIAQYQKTTNASAIQENSAIKSERVDYYDLGIKHRLTENINIGLDSYYKNINNLLDKGQFGNAMIYSHFNYKKGRAYGFEFSSDYKKNNFSAYFNAAYQKITASNIASG